MSATLDSDLFCSFFNGAPLISVPGRTFPVSNYYLEDLIEATHHVIEEGSRYAKYEGRYTEQASLMVTQRGGDKRKEVVDLSLAIDPIEISALYESYSTSTRRSMERVDENIINYDLIEDVLELLLLGDNSSQTFGIDLSSGSILVFLPGLGEIKSMTERLEGSRHFNSKLCQIIPMVKKSANTNITVIMNYRTLTITLIRVFSTLPYHPMIKEEHLSQVDCAK